jgi:uncharacterized protein YndB with AHSA1/START domain
VTGFERSVHEQAIPAGEARAIVLRRVYDAPVADVWDAITDPERLARFFFRPTGDLREGGSFDLGGTFSGEIVRCAPPELLRLTWLQNAAPASRPADEVEVRLTPGDAGRTVLELEHASVTRTVEVAGHPVDVFLNDPEHGVWGLAAGWELGLVALGDLLGARLGGDWDRDWSSPRPPAEIQAMADAAGVAWAEVLEAASAT